MYLGWFDADKRKAPADKIAEAAARYTEKYGARPDLALCNPLDLCECDSLTVRAVSYVRKDNFLLGQQDDSKKT